MNIISDIRTQQNYPVSEHQGIGWILQKPGMTCHSIFTKNPLLLNLRIFWSHAIVLLAVDNNFAYMLLNCCLFTVLLFHFNFICICFYNALYIFFVCWLIICVCPHEKDLNYTRDVYCDVNVIYVVQVCQFFLGAYCCTIYNWP